MILAGTAGPAVSQTTVSISGHLYDACDGAPVAYAKVLLAGTNYAARADQSGRFCFESIPAGRYILEVNADGYLPATDEIIDVVPDITRRVTIRLDRRLVYVGETTVRGRGVPLRIPGLTIVEGGDIRRSHAENLVEILGRMEGIHIREAGPSGGGTQVSIRGCAPEHVLVLLDGRKINPSATGVADLSTIPLEIIERVEVYRGGQSARFGADALGGVINIITRMRKSDNPPEVTLGQQWSKWKTKNYTATLVNPLPLTALTSKFSAGYFGTNGDFDYRYTVSPQSGPARIYTGDRFNGDQENASYFGTGTYSLGVNTSLSLSGQAFLAREGLPGSVSRPDSTARKRDMRLLASMAVRYAPSDYRLVEFSLGVSRLRQEFANSAAARPSQRYDTRFTNDLADAQALMRRRLGPGNELSAGMTLRRDILYHDDILKPQEAMGRTIRDNAGLFLSDRQIVDLKMVPFWDIAAFDASLRWDNTETRRAPVSPDDAGQVHHTDFLSKKIGFSVARGDSARLTVRGSYGTSFRLPSINALFWKGDVRAQGNPDLRPERSEHSEIGIDLAIAWQARIAAGMTYFHSFVRDLIVWRPSSPDGIWMPANLAAARITGHEDFVRLEFFGRHLCLGYRNTVTTAVNRSPASAALGNFLTYRPHYVTQLDCELEYRYVRARYEIRMVDKRYALDANTKWYDAYRIDNLDLGLTAGVSSLELEVTYRMKNLRDEKYVLIAQYPMPGREWSISAGITYRMK